jgi:hypothetical protein
MMVTLMMVCLAVVLFQAGGLLGPRWRADYLPTFCFFISLEAILSQRTIRNKPVLSPEWFLYFGAEWVLILIVLKLFMGLRSGAASLLHEISYWRVNFINNFFNSEYAFALLIVFVVWVISRMFADDLAELEGDELILKTAGLEPLPSNRRGIHQRLMSRSFIIGAAMIVIMGLFAQDRLALWENKPVSQGGILSVIFYFLFALILFSQTNFAALRASWGYERVGIQKHLASRWIVYSLLFLILLTTLVLLLPTRYSLGFLDSLRYVIGFIGKIIGFILTLLLLPFMFLFYLLSRLLMGGNKEPPTVKINPFEGPLFPQETAVHTASWWEILKSVLFWGVLVIVISYAIYQYLQQNRELAAALSRFIGWRWLVRAMRWLRDQYCGLRKNAAAVIQVGLRRLRSLGGTPSTEGSWRFLNLRRLSPRQRVIFYYLALVRRGSEAGVPRQPSQTPYDYSRSLALDVPEVSDSVSEITDAFVDARYSRHDVATEQAERVKQYWERIRRALREWRR